MLNSGDFLCQICSSIFEGNPWQQGRSGQQPPEIYFGGRRSMIRCYKEHIPEGNGAILTDGKVALSDTFRLFNQTLNRPQKWFNSIFNSKLNLKYSFNQKFIKKFVQNIQFTILFKKLEKSDSKCQLNINVIFEPSVRACC